MSKKVVHVLVFLFICLLSGSLILIPLGATVQPWTPGTTVPDQAHTRSFPPVPTPQKQVDFQAAFGPLLQLNAQAAPAEKLELLTPLMGQVISHTMHIEPIQLQIAGKILAETRNSPLGSIHQPGSTYITSNDDIRTATECVVTSMDDSGAGTLRQCLENAVAGDIITFDAVTFPPTDPTTIDLSSALPWITIDNLFIDAGDAGVVLDGSELSSGCGFVITGTHGVKIQGLQIVNFPVDGVAISGGATNTVIGGDRSTGNGPMGQGNLISGNGRLGIWLQDPGTMNNNVLGNFIGTDISGSNPLGNVLDGVAIGYGATNNTIGGNTPGTRNLISGNGDDGVQLQNMGTTDNKILGNFIGTNASGTIALGNVGDGVFIFMEASNNFIGWDTSEAGNLISGNNGDAGVKIAGNGTEGNVVLGNYIGTDVSGNAALADIEHGVVIYDGATYNTIGGTTPGARNLISGNREAGIVIAYAGASDNQVLGNYIGTDASGTISIPNYWGVLIFEGPTDNTIGGDGPGAGNLISGNTEAGVRIEGSGTMNNQVTLNTISSNGEDGVVIRNAARNQVLGNYIGTDPTGTTPLGNLRNGIILDDASYNIIGGVTAGAGNLISGNEFAGIYLQGSGTTSNQIQGNFIGTDVSGTLALGNLSEGIRITSEASDNLIGGNRFTGSGPLGQGNLISSNEDTGIMLEGSGTTGNQIQGNFIGTDVSGMAMLGNHQGGIFIVAEASNNIVGGNTPGVCNLISGNISDGIRLQDSGTIGNQVQGNFIGTNVSGTAALGNLQVGVALLGGVSNNLIGGDTSGAGNLVSGNEVAGMYLQNSGTTGNQVQGNFIGTDVSGTVTVGNHMGIVLLAGVSNNLIGGDRYTGSGPLGQGNLISGNEDIGIVLDDTGTIDNQIQGNFVGTNIFGTASLGNHGHGVVISFGASNNVIGGNASNVRNLVSGNKEGGVWLQDPGTTGNQVQGNFIGTDIFGAKALGNLLGGVILIREPSNNLIGGELPGQGNLISGNQYPGVTLMWTGTSNNRVQGNLIGTDVSGTAELGNFGYGFFIIEGASNNTIGGATTAAGNIIAFNSSHGVYVEGDQTTDNMISHNSIYNNGGLGIETTNGGNIELTPPTITTVTSSSVSGQSQPDHVVEIFSDNSDEGCWFEGSVMADGTGVFTLTYSGVFSGFNLTATATDTDGNTSEFSAPFNVWDEVFLPIIIKNSS